MRMYKLSLVGYYLRSSMAAEQGVVIFGLKVEDTFDSLVEV